MTVALTTPQFKANAHRALGDEQLQEALSSLPEGLVGDRTRAAARLPEFEALRDSARDIKNHTLAHLDLYLESYEKKVTESGGHKSRARGLAFLPPSNRSRESEARRAARSG